MDFDELDGLSQEYFLKVFSGPGQKIEAEQSLNFYPLTAQIVAIAMLDVDSEKGFVFFQNGEDGTRPFVDGRVTYVPSSEENTLRRFWKVAESYDQFVSFNGRCFDAPFIMLRSMHHHVRCSKNLMPYRYSYGVHVDLADQLTFYDAMRRRFNLHLWCKAFDIKSPKEAGISGLQVKELFQAQQYERIARYCFTDVVATKQLYLLWNEYIKF